MSPSGTRQSELPLYASAVSSGANSPPTDTTTLDDQPSGSSPCLPCNASTMFLRTPSPLSVEPWNMITGLSAAGRSAPLPCSLVHGSLYGSSALQGGLETFQKI